MTKQRFVYLILIFLMAGCSSSPEKTATEIKTENKAQKDSANHVEETPELVAPAVVPTPTPVDTNAVYGNITKSLKINNSAQVTEEAAKILIQNPNDVKALNALGVDHYKNGRRGAAVLMWERALKVNEENASLHNNIGVALRAEGEILLAIKSFKKALTIDSGNAFAMANLGAIYVEGGDGAKALPLLENAHSKIPRDNSITLNLALAQRYVGKYADSEQNLNQVLRQEPNNTAAMLNMAVLLIEYANKPKDGLNWVKRLRLVEGAQLATRLNSLEKRATSGLK